MEENTNDVLIDDASKTNYSGGVHPIKGGLLKLPFVNNPALGFATLFIAFIIGLVITSVVMYMLMTEDGLSHRLMQVVTVIQDVLAFIAPAIIAAIVVTRLPAAQLALNVKPNIRLLLYALALVVIMQPAMSYIYALNQNIPLPETIEEILRTMEDSAASAVSQLAGNNTVANYILGILILGLLTGLAEEIFFRGTLQNLMFQTTINKHLCVWITAFIFSAIHFQFYGFVPRLLLGAYFGYLIWWTGSLWIPVLCHALNNAMAVTAQYTDMQSLDPASADFSLDQFGATEFALISASLVFTVVGLYQLHRYCTKPALLK